MKKFVLALFIVISIMIFVTQSNAGDEVLLYGTMARSDILIILDMSASMSWDPEGHLYYPGTVTWIHYPDRRIDKARFVIYDLLDADGSGRITRSKEEITDDDENILNVRLGYMRYLHCDPDGNPKDGNIKVLSDIGEKYRKIWEEVSKGNPSTATPLAQSLVEAKKYFKDYINPKDTAIACRKKYVILITDGADTCDCNGNGYDTTYKMRLKTVQRAKELYESDPKVKIFAVGFGKTGFQQFRQTLEWVAKYGGTDNPSVLNEGDPNTYDITKYIPTGGDPCTTTATQAQADPESYSLRGYAFMAEDEDQLSDAMKTIMQTISYIQEHSYFFAAPTVPSTRTLDSNVIYISYILPKESGPFWEGNIKAYDLDANGTLRVDANGYPDEHYLKWGAFDANKNLDPGSRKIYTVVGGVRKDFVYGNLTNEDLDVPSVRDRADLVNHIRGIDAYDTNGNGNKTEARESKLGDIFHSNAVIVGSPSPFFEDVGFSGTGNFYDQNKNRTKVIIVGANDGMLHAFNAASGVEEWGFIPNSLLKNLKNMKETHTYYVDSTPKVADVWFYPTFDATGYTKNKDEWRTVLVCGLRKGGNTYFALDITDTKNPQYLWEFPKSTDAATLAKVGQSWSEPTIGRVKIEDGNNNLIERWVAFIGGGYDPSEKIDKDAIIGKVFLVIDMKTGEIIKEFSGLDGMTHAFAASPTAVDTDFDGYVDKVYIGDLGGQMWVFNVSFDEISKKSNSQWTGKILFKAPGGTAEKHPIYYQPSVAFDQHATLWVFFGTGDREDPNNKNNSKERFYAVKDDGKGNKDGKYPLQEGDDLSDVTGNNTFTQPKDPLKGWYIKLDKSEKVLAKPSVFNRLLYFTTYTPTSTNAGQPESCEAPGNSNLYIVEYLSGGGALTVDDLSQLSGTPSDRSKRIGGGVPSPPVITVDMRGKGTVIIETSSGKISSKEIFSRQRNKELLYWREVIP
jgi:type IV pilus assembly protein PilY1